MKALVQELEVWYVIPAIRRELARCFINEHAISYDKIGKILGISKAAVSQYVQNKRAAKIKLPEQALLEVCKSCNKMVKGKSNSVEEITKILDFIKKKKLACEVCDRSPQGILEGCKEIRTFQ
jgi:predicted transcriptional regulator